MAVSSNYELVEAPDVLFTTMNDEREYYACSEIWITVREAKIK